MRTDDLVRKLAAEVGHTGLRSGSSLLVRLFIGTAIPAVVVLFVILAFFSLSPHLAHGLHPTMAFTVAAAVLLAVAAFGGSLLLARPEVDKAPTLALIAAGAILAAGCAIELARVPPRDWLTNLMGSQPHACFISVFVLSLPILFGTLLALRHGAPSRPAVAGAFAGLLSGGVTAALYVIHCPEDSLLFIAAWHVPAILLVSGLGALLGPRMLRW